MRLAALLLWTSACTSPCKPNTVFLSLSFDAQSAQTDSLLLLLSTGGQAPLTQPQTLSHPFGQTSSTVEVQFHSYVPGTTFDVFASALFGGMQRGTGQAHFPLAEDCSAASINITAPVLPDLSEPDAPPGGQQGARCTANDQCQNGICTDGFCCSALCDGQCEACNIVGMEGTCTAVVGTPLGARADCAGGGTLPCGGRCDGVNRASCSYPTVACRAGSCSGGVATDAASCSMGVCPALSMTACSGTTNTKFCGATSCVGVTQVVAGADYSCALMSDGTVRCWGQNGSGQLGFGTANVDPVPTPSPLPGLGNVARLSASFGPLGHTCALLGDGTATCFGSNANGELGRGTTDAHLGDHQPVLASSGSTFTGIADIAAGGTSTCLIDTGGAPWCFGVQTSGQLGDGVSGAGKQLFPVKVMNGGTSASGIQAGLFGGCVANGKTTTSGALCWGSNSSSQMGNNAASNPQTTAIAVTSIGSNVDATFHGAVQVGTDSGTACAITTSSALQCWGSNTYNLLGRNVDSAGLAISLAAGNVCITTANPCTTSTDILRQVTSFGIGLDFACAVAGGVVRCWGREIGFGSLGDGTLGDGAGGSRTVLNAGQGPSLTGVESVAVGSLHACAVLTDHTVRCWGRGAEGELGDGLQTNSATPVSPLF